MFIKVTDTRYGDTEIINLDAIAEIHIASNTITLNCVHGEGNGLLHVTKQDIQRILKNISLVEEV